MSLKKINVRYYASLREQRGVSEETIQSKANTAADLYQELSHQHNFSLSADLLKVAINEEFVDWQTQVSSGDNLTFIPPVSGG